MSKKLSELNSIQDAGEYTGKRMVDAISSGISLPSFLMLFILGLLISCKPLVIELEEEDEKP